MRLSLWLAGIIAVVLVLAGFRPDALPFIPDSAFSDATVSHYPATYHLRESIGRGEFPVWQELNMAGQPFAANPLNKTAYPLQWLAVLLPPALHLNVMIVLHVAIAAWGMWRWTRALGLRAEAAAVGALSYALAPRALGHLGAGHLDLLYALAWFPHLMLATWQVCRLPHPLPPSPLRKEGEQEKSRRDSTRAVRFWKSPLYAVERGFRGEVLHLALFASLLLLSDVRLSLFAFISAAAYGVSECWRARRWQPMLAGMAALLPFAAVTAALTVPLALWSPYLSRSTLTVQEAGAFSLSPAYLIGVLLSLPSGDVEMLTYVGSATLLLAILAIVIEPRKHRLWLGLIVFAVLYALGTNSIAWQTLTAAIPVLRWFRVPARAWFIVALVAPLLAAYGSQLLFEWAERTRVVSKRQVARTRLLIIVYMMVVSVTGVLMLLTSNRAVATGSLLILIAGNAIGIVLLLTLSKQLRGRMLTIALLLVVAFDLGANGLRWLEWRGRDDWFAPYAPLADYLRADGADRIYSPAYSLPQQVAVEYDLYLFGGVDPFQLSRTADAIERASGVGDHGYSVVQPPQPAELDQTWDDMNGINRSAIPDVELLAAWQVSHVVAPYGISDPQLRELTVIDGIYVYSNLAYSQTLALDRIPRWVESPDLPTLETVTRNNALTAQVAVFSAAAFILLLVLTITLEVRRK